MKVIVDRIEGDFAVCETENLEMIDIPFKDIPFIPKEGDVLLMIILKAVFLNQMKRL